MLKYMNKSYPFHCWLHYCSMLIETWTKRWPSLQFCRPKDSFWFFSPLFLFVCASKIIQYACFLRSDQGT